MKQSIKDYLCNNYRITTKGTTYLKELLLRKVCEESKLSDSNRELIGDAIEDIWWSYYMKHPFMFIKDKIKRRAHI